MAILLPQGKQQYDGILGLPLVGGKVYTYAAGTNTPLATYADAAGTVPNTNPVILDARGEALIFWYGAYKVRLTDANDNVIWTVDNVVAPDLAQSIDAVAADLAAFKTQLLSTAGAGLIGYASPTKATDVDATLDLIYPGNNYLLGQAIDKLQGGTAISIACYGDSLTYGQDTSVNGQTGTLPFNGSSIARSRYPYPETLSDAMALNQYGVTTTVINRGYPGDTAEMGYNRWAAASATDIAIIMFGTNDGKTRTVPIGTYKLWMQRWIEREIGKGAVVVLMTTTPVNDTGTETNIAAYRDVCRQLATEYRLLCIETFEMLSGVTGIWSEATDLVHLSSYAYAEIGWQLSTLLNNRDLGAKHLDAGAIWYPHDSIGYGGSVVTSAAGRSGQFITLTPGERYFIAGYFEDDVLPVVHSYNSGGTNAVVTMQYSGNGTFRGIVSPQLNHIASIDPRQALTGPTLRRGFRTLLVLNNGTVNVNIDAIEFLSLDVGSMSRGLMRPSNALSGRHCPASQLAALAGEAWTQIDYSLPLAAPYRVSARVTIADLAGIGVFKNREGPTFASDFLVARRNGTALELVETVAGVATTTTTAAVFSGAFTGEIELVVTSADAKVYVDGVLKLTKATPTNLTGFPALIAYPGASGFYCGSAAVKGYLKGPY